MKNLFSNSAEKYTDDLMKIESDKLLRLPWVNSRTNFVNYHPVPGKYEPNSLNAKNNIYDCAKNMTYF